jgi:hypothetical protein
MAQKAGSGVTFVSGRAKRFAFDAERRQLGRSGKTIA